MLTRWTGRRSERSRSPSGEATFDERRKGRVSRAEGPHLREEGNYSSWALARSRRRAAPAAPSVQRALPRTDTARLPDAPCRCTHHSPPQELSALLQNPGGRPAPHLPLTPHARPPADCSHPPGSTSRGCFTLAQGTPATPGASRGLPTSPPLLPWPPGPVTGVWERGDESSHWGGGLRCFFSAGASRGPWFRGRTPRTATYWVTWSSQVKHTEPRFLSCPPRLATNSSDLPAPGGKARASGCTGKPGPSASHTPPRHQQPCLAPAQGLAWGCCSGGWVPAPPPATALGGHSDVSGPPATESPALGRDPRGPAFFPGLDGSPGAGE